MRRIGGGSHPTIDFTHPAATSARRRQAAHAAASLRFAPSGDCAGPMRRFASMAFGERSRPAGRLVSPKTMEANGLSRAEGSRFALATAKRLGLDAEYGSGWADFESVPSDKLFLNCRISAILSLWPFRRFNV